MDNAACFGLIIGRAFMGDGGEIADGLVRSSQEASCHDLRAEKDERYAIQ